MGMFIRVKRALDQDEPSCFINVPDRSEGESGQKALKRFKLYRAGDVDTEAPFDIYVKTEQEDVNMIPAFDCTVPVIEEDNIEYLNDLYVDELELADQDEDADSNDEGYYANDYPDEDGEYRYGHIRGAYSSQYMFEIYDELSE